MPHWALAYRRGRVVRARHGVPLLGMVLGLLLLGAFPAAGIAPPVIFTGAQTTVPASGLGHPHGVAVDGAGDVFIADANNNRVVKVPAGGGAQTTVGSGLSFPWGVAVDGTGDVFIADSNNNRVVKVPAGGGTQTTVGTGLNGPTDVAVDGAGDVFIADYGNNRVVKVPAGGGAQTTVGSGLGHPAGVAVDGAGDVFIAEPALDKVVEVAAGGTQTTVPTSGLSQPFAVAVDSAGNVFIADQGNNRVVEVAAGGGAQTTLPTSGLNGPDGVAVDSVGNVFIGDTVNNRVVEVQRASVNFAGVNIGSSSTLTLNYSVNNNTTFGTSPTVVTQGAPNLDFTLSSNTCTSTIDAGNSCTVIAQFAPRAPGLRMGAVQLTNSTGKLLATTMVYGIGQGPAMAFGPGAQSTLNVSVGGSGLYFPFGEAVDAADDVFIADSGNSRVVKVPPGGGAQTTVGSGLLEPAGVAVDGAGDVFIADFGNNRVVEVPAGGGAQTTVGSGLLEPAGVAVDGAGDVFIADSLNSRVVEVPAGGGAQTTVGTGLYEPTDVAVDGAGDVFIVDYGNSRVVEVPAGGGAQTTVGSGLIYPYGVAVDGAGDVFIADTDNSRVVEVPAGGGAQITVESGLNTPYGVAVDGAGNVFIADSANSRGVEVQRSAPPTFSFGATAVGSTSSDSPQSVTVQNIGNQSLDAISPGLSIGATSFEQAAGPGTPPDCTSTFSLAPGASCNLSVMFIPQTTGSIASDATFTDNALNGNLATQNISLSGTGLVAPTSTAVTSSPTSSSVYGQSVTFTATVTANGLPVTAGSVTFNDTTTSATLASNVALNSSGQASVSLSTLAVGNHTIEGIYNPDANHSTSNNSESFAVNRANSTTNVVSSPNPSVFGQSVTFTATLSATAPGAGTPTGSVTFLDGGSSIGSGTLSGGVATLATSALAPGNHMITTSYAGDGNFNGSTGSLTGNPQVVNKANSNTGVTSTVNPSVFGQSVTLTATLSAVSPGAGTPTGSVTFLDGGSSIGSGTLSGGVATLTTSALAPGSHTITTSYSGDGNFNGGTGSLTGNPQVVNKANSTTGVTSSANPSVFGQSVILTATLSAVAPGAGTPTGSVTFLDGGSSIGSGTLSGGVATLTTSALAPGNHAITTSYAGDGNFNGSAGSLTGNPQVVNRASSTTGVTSSANPSVFGQSVTLTATVSPVAPGAGTPTGSVTFLDGGSSIGSGMLSGGVATLTTSALAVGSHTITTSYGGDGNFNGSTGSLTGNPQVVNKAGSSTGVMSTVNPSIFGQSVTLTATLSAASPGAGTPTGSVTFLDGGSSIGSGTLSGGVATLTTSALAPGNHAITTSYAGDGNFNGSAGSLTGNPQVVTKANSNTGVTSSVNPSVFGQSVILTATLSAAAPGAGTPTGSVTFLDGGSSIGSGTLSGGVATLTTSALAPGNRAITTSYAGDGNFNSSAGSLTGNPQVVNKASSSTGVTSSLNASVYGQSVTLTATVSAVAPGVGTPTGSVTFLDGGSSIGGGTLSGGVATFTTSALTAGNHTITTSYSGDGNFNVSTGSLTGNPQVVNKATPTISLVPSANPSVVFTSLTFTATVSSPASTPTGTLTFFDGTTQLSLGPLAAGVATYTSSIFTVGAHSITAVYSGDANFLGGSSSGVAEQVNQATPTISWTPAAGITYGATLSGILNASALNGTLPVAGSFAYTATPSGGSASTVTSATVLVAGSYTLTATFTPTDTTDYKSVSASAAFTVTKAQPTVSLVSSLNPVLKTNSVTLTATVSSPASTPTGSVSFYDGTTLVSSGTLTAGGVATYTTSSLAIGTHSLTVSYSGDANFASATSSVVAQLVEDFNLNVSPAPAGTASPVLYPGSTATYVFSVGPSNGLNFPSAVTFTLSGLPPGATGTLTPASLAAGSAGTNITLVIQLANQILAHNRANPLGRGLALAMVGGIFLLPFGTRMRRSAGKAGRWAGLLMLMLAIICATLGLSACGGTSGGYFGQQPVNYTVTITATSGALSHTTSVTLTVQ